MASLLIGGNAFALEDAPRAEGVLGGRRGRELSEARETAKRLAGSGRRGRQRRSYRASNATFRVLARAAVKRWRCFPRTFSASTTLFFAAMRGAVSRACALSRNVSRTSAHKVASAACSKTLSASRRRQRAKAKGWQQFRRSGGRACLAGHGDGRKDGVAYVV